MLEYEDLPEDYLSTYRDNINNVTIETIKEVAESYLDPDKAIMLVVGNDAVYKEVTALFPEIKKIESP